MAEGDLISVIVPVYNVRPYLERCFNSIIRQTYQNLEIILVDDGSTDGSETLCDALAERDSRAKVIHKKNGGQGSARNVGMKQATGQLFGFVDSDDWIDLNMYKSMLLSMYHANAEICVCGIQNVRSDGSISYYNDNLKERKVFSTEEALIELPKNERLTNSVCNKLFRRETIEGMLFDETIAYEDNLFTPQCIGRATHILYIAEPFYCYFERTDSTTRKAFSSSEFDRVRADRLRLDFYNEHFPVCANEAAIAYIGSCLKVYYSSRDCRETREQRRRLKTELREAIRQYPELPYTGKQRAKVKLFSASPALYTTMMYLRGKR